MNFIKIKMSRVASFDVSGISTVVVVVACSEGMTSWELTQMPQFGFRTVLTSQ